MTTRPKAAVLLAVVGVLAACGAAPPPVAATTGEPPAPPSMAPASAAPTAPAVEPTLLTMPSAQTPVVAVRLMFRSGSADDPPDLPGATALAASLMADGGTEGLTAYDVKQRLFPWAASISVHTDADLTTFTATVHRDHAAAFVPLLVDVLTAPRWDAAEFERMRRDAIDDLEKRLRTTDDENLGKAALAGLMYPGHPYGHPVGGTVAGLKAMTLARLRSHAATVFCKARLAIGLAGGYPAETPDTLLRGLAALPEGAERAPLPAVSLIPPAPRVLLVEKDAPAVAVSLGAPVDYDRADPDFAALMVGVSAFGEHRQFHGRLMQRLREQRGLNYGDYAYVEHFSQAPGSTFPEVGIVRRQQAFTIWLRPVQPGDARFALRLALHEYASLLSDGLTEAEVRQAAAFLEGYTRLWEKNAQRRLGLALDDALTGTPERLARFRAALPGLTAAQVNAALRKHLPPVDALRIAVVTSKAGEFKDALVAGTPSPKTYNSEKPKALLDVDARVAVAPFGLSAADIRVVPVDALF